MCLTPPSLVIFILVWARLNYNLLREKTKSNGAPVTSAVQVVVPGSDPRVCVAAYPVLPTQLEISILFFMSLRDVYPAIT